MNNELNEINKKNYKTLTPFKGWVIENFPFIEADFDAITNYQLICKVTEYLNTVIYNQNQVQNLSNELVDGYNNLLNYVNKYFDNLDVQEEINNKLDEMAQDGTLTNLIKNYVDPYLNNFNTRLNNQDETITNQNEAINTLKNRMDTFASLPDGSTAGDAELEDIRIGYDGIVYNSAGDSVRTQVEDIYTNFGEFQYVALSGESEFGYYYNASGNHNTGSAYMNRTFEVESNSVYYISTKAPSSGICAVLYYNDDVLLGNDGTGGSIDWDKHKITTPSNCNKMIVSGSIVGHVNVYNYKSVPNILNYSVNDLISFAPEIMSSSWEEMTAISTETGKYLSYQNTVSTLATYSYSVFNVKPNTKYKVTLSVAGTDVCPVAFYNDTDIINIYERGAVTYDEEEIITPPDCNKLYCSYLNAYGITVKNENLIIGDYSNTNFENIELTPIPNTYYTSNGSISSSTSYSATILNVDPEHDYYVTLNIGGSSPCAVLYYNDDVLLDNDGTGGSILWDRHKITTPASCNKMILSGSSSYGIVVEIANNFAYIPNNNQEIEILKNNIINKEIGYLNKGVVVFTDDDGTSGTKNNVFPIISQYNIPFVFGCWINSDILDNDNISDTLSLINNYNCEIAQHFNVNLLNRSINQLNYIFKNEKVGFTNKGIEISNFIAPNNTVDDNLVLSISQKFNIGCIGGNIVNTKRSPIYKMNRVKIVKNNNLSYYSNLIDDAYSNKKAIIFYFHGNEMNDDDNKTRLIEVIQYCKQKGIYIVNLNQLFNL